MGAYYGYGSKLGGWAELMYFFHPLKQNRIVYYNVAPWSLWHQRGIKAFKHTEKYEDVTTLFNSEQMRLWLLLFYFEVRNVKMQSLQKAWKRNIKNMFFRCSLFQSDNHWVTHSLQWNKVICISGGVNVNRKSDINWKLSSLQPVRSDLTPQNSLINLSVWLLYLKPICFLISSSTIGKPSFLTLFILHTCNKSSGP